MFRALPTIAKAITAAATAFGSTFATALLPDAAGVSVITPAEWVTVAIATLVAGAGVYAVPNAQVPPQADEREFDTDDSLL